MVVRSLCDGNIRGLRVDAPEQWTFENRALDNGYTTCKLPSPYFVIIGTIAHKYSDCGTYVGRANYRYQAVFVCRAFGGLRESACSGLELMTNQAPSGDDVEMLLLLLLLLTCPLKDSCRGCQGYRCCDVYWRRVCMTRQKQKEKKKKKKKLSKKTMQDENRMDLTS